MKKILTVVFSLILISSGINTAEAAQIVLAVASDYSTGYDRSLFKHWIDADKDGCNTRNEVLIEEAVVKPKVGKKCKLIGGSWVSPYDLKVVTNPSLLDIDHTVPLAEAWRSGAWNWTPNLREQYANELRIPGALAAVSLSLNRQKGDKDVSEWFPPKSQCKYYSDWIAVKASYGLTVDTAEANVLKYVVSSCGFDNVVIGLVTPTSTPTSTPTQDTTPALTLCNDGTYSSSTNSETCSGHGGIANATPAAQSTPEPTASSSGPKQCYVSGYTRKNGTRVSGYYRSC